MRQPRSGSKFAVTCETEEVSGDSTRLTGPAHANAVSPPAISPRNARRPYGRVSGGGVSVGSGADDVGEREDVDRERPAVKPAPGLGADPAADVEAAGEDQHEPAADDAEAGPKGPEVE